MNDEMEYVDASCVRVGCVCVREVVCLRKGEW